MFLKGDVWRCNKDYKVIERLVTVKNDYIELPIDVFNLSNFVENIICENKINRGVYLW